MNNCHVVAFIWYVCRFFGRFFDNQRVYIITVLRPRTIMSTSRLAEPCHTKELISVVLYQTIRFRELASVSTRISKCRGINISHVLWTQNLTFQSGFVKSFIKLHQKSGSYVTIIYHTRDPATLTTSVWSIKHVNT